MEPLFTLLTLNARKLRGAMLSLIESEDVQKQQPPQSAGQIQTRGSVEPRSSTFVKNDGVPSFEQITRETLLPFTVHGNSFNREKKIFMNVR